MSRLIDSVFADEDAAIRRIANIDAKAIRVAFAKIASDAQLPTFVGDIEGAHWEAPSA